MSSLFPLSLVHHNLLRDFISFLKSDYIAIYIPRLFGQSVGVWIYFSITINLLYLLKLSRAHWKAFVNDKIQGTYEIMC